MGTVTLTTEEYEALLRLQSSERESEGSRLADRKRKSRRRSGKKDPKMAKALKRANEIGRKKNGGYKKGYSQSKIMSLAHKLRRKM